MYKKNHIGIAEIEMLPGNIFHVEITHGAEVTLEGAKRLIRATNQMLEPENPFRGGIYDLTKITYVNGDAREYLTSGEDVEGIVVAVAMISNSFLGKAVGNLVLSLSNTTPFPIRFFESPIRAEHWVRLQFDEARKNRLEAVRKVA